MGGTCGAHQPRATNRGSRLARRSSRAWRATGPTGVDGTVNRDPTSPLDFYDVDDEQRHGFGDPLDDRERLARILIGIRSDAVVLEVGCGRGRLSDLHRGWFGIDLGHPTLARYVPGRSAQADATQLPVADASVGAVISVEALEHVPNPEAALDEMLRVLEPGGVLYLRPAWFCSQWPMNAPRSPSSLRPSQRLRWLLLAARYSRPARLPGVLLRKARAERDLWLRRPRPLRWRPLVPDYTRYWAPDSDAAASLEPNDLIAWLSARGFEIVEPAGRLARLSHIRGPIVARAPGSSSRSNPARLVCPLCRAPLNRLAAAVRCTGPEVHEFAVQGDVPRLVRPISTP